MKYLHLKQYKVAQQLVDFVNNIVLPGLTLDSAEYWEKFESILLLHNSKNNELLTKRDDLQEQIDEWFHQHTYDKNSYLAHKQFLTNIGYLLEEGENFKISVGNVDSEISSIAAPQLVVPINKPRFVINAANARWGSLFNALYGSDMIADKGEIARSTSYNEKRGERVHEFCNQWLDEAIPLHEGSHSTVKQYQLSEQGESKLVTALLNDGAITTLKYIEQFCGYSQNENQILLFNHNDLYFELQLNQQGCIKDIILEAAVSTIIDCEDSVSAVDIEDKMQVYNNWFELIKGSIRFDLEKAGNKVTRVLNDDRSYTDRQGEGFKLPGRSLMLIRNTGLHMFSELVLTDRNEKVAEGLVDALITVLISMHDLLPDSKIKNSRQDSIYIVKPKLHGPEEVAFSCKVFTDIEKAYGLAENTIKIGIMDEERRTTVNLKECIRQAKHRVIFINTGFLDRTGDEIHTSMEAGAMLQKAEIKTARWISAYEDWNVDTGLLCGLDGIAQIGKGMWAEPDNLLDMYKSKISHPQSGANCAWVPSPTAATIHALHYHKIDVRKQQQVFKNRKRASVDDILSIPLLPPTRQLTKEEIQLELDNNAQSILGYVVKWIDMGIGCSKVPDINHTELMEDRATLRISSQLLANWLRHGLFNKLQLTETFKRMAVIVDQQNEAVPGYVNMAPQFNGLAFEAALNLVLQGTKVANGYTEDILHKYRQRMKGKI